MSTTRRSAIGTAVAALLCLVAGLTPGSAQQPARVSPDTYKELRWRFVGPEGNRVSAVAGVPGDPLVYYAGSASGGVWKTEDGGVHWRPVLSSPMRVHVLPASVDL